MILHSRISSDGGGGGIHMAPGVRGSKYKLHHQAEVIIYFMRDRIHVGKNRFSGEVGDVTPAQFMDIALKYFSREIYNDIAEVFQQGLIDQIHKAIYEILSQNSLTKEIGYDTLFRTSSGDGS
jgi:hypothetical protein